MFPTSKVDHRSKKTARTEPVVRKFYNEVGEAYFKIIGEQDIVSDIQSYKKGCSLQNVLDRIAYLPVEQKISYLQQTSASIGHTDLVGMPSDGTAAHIMITDFQKQYPDIDKRIRSGESFNTVLTDFIKKQTAAIKTDVKEKENIENGTN